MFGFKKNKTRYSDDVNMNELKISILAHCATNSNLLVRVEQLVEISYEATFSYTNWILIFIAN